MTFWVVVSILLLFAMLVIAIALLHRDNIASDAHHQRIVRNVKLYRQRLAGYQEELDQDFITQENYDSLANELSRQLLNDVSDLERAPAQGHVRHKWLLLLVPVPLLALVFYAALGAYPDWQITRQLIDVGNSATAEEYQQRSAGLQQRLEQRVQQKPDHIEYRNLLARFAMARQDYAEAALHYGILAELLPDDDEALALFAQAEYLHNGRKMTPQIVTAMDRALAINPNQTTVLGIKGIHALESGDLPGAVEAWEKLLAVLPPDSEQSQLLSQAVAKAREQLGQKGEAKTALKAVAAGITIHVGVDDALRNVLGRLDGNLPVFVYAVAASGPAMPLAVLKLRLRDLPTEVRLDDSMAMMPNMRLSGFDQVVFGARISLSGQAVARPGDWEGKTAAVAWKKTGRAEVVISSAVK